MSQQTDQGNIQFAGTVATLPYSVPSDQIIIYSDWNFFPENFNLSINIEAVLNSLINLLSTVPGERLNNPEYGIGIETELFEIMDFITRQTLMIKVIQAIRRWEPRVILNQKLCYIKAHEDEHIYEVSLTFSVLGLSGEFNLKRFYKQKSRGIKVGGTTRARPQGLFTS